MSNDEIYIHTTQGVEDQSKLLKKKTTKKGGAYVHDPEGVKISVEEEEQLREWHNQRKNYAFSLASDSGDQALFD